jgi:SHAQKYF class myb-like DNA-binding protein
MDVPYARQYSSPGSGTTDNLHPREAVDPTQRRAVGSTVGSTVGSAVGSAVGSTAGKSWDEEEHMQFLRGLHAFGRGQWKQISKYYVPSRTPTQVASHAQKHFLRVTGHNGKRRSKFAAVDAAAEMQFGAAVAVTRDGVPGDGGSGGGAAVAAVEGFGGVDAVLSNSSHQHKHHRTQSKRRRASSVGGNQNASEDTGSARQMFAEGSLYHAGAKTVPPVQSDGVALGIPLQEIPDLKAYGGRNLPMLKVIKGRIPLPVVSNLFRPSSPSPSQKKQVEDEQMAPSEAGNSRPKRTRRPSNRSNIPNFPSHLSNRGGDVEVEVEVEVAGGFDLGALAALADVAAGLAEHDGALYTTTK